MMLINIIFCKFYEWARRLNYWDTPHLSAMYFLSLLLYLNMLSLFVIIKLIFGYAAELPRMGIVGIIGLLAGVTFLVYLIYIRKKRYLMLGSSVCGSIENKKKAKYNLIVIAYIIFSVLLFFGLAFV
jgi:hypothetical protein